MCFNYFCSLLKSLSGHFFVLSTNSIFPPLFFSLISAKSVPNVVPVPVSTASTANRMSGAYNPNQKVQKVMVQPINLIFRYLQNRTVVSVWLYENVNTRIEGHIIGFDEYMNLVLDDAAEVHLKRRTRKEVRLCLLVYSVRSHNLARVTLGLVALSQTQTLSPPPHTWAVGGWKGYRYPPPEG